MALFLLFWPLYLVPFLVLFAIPRWRWFVPAAIAAACLTLWQWGDVQHADGPGALFAAAGVFVVAVGFVAGGTARVAVLATERWLTGILPNAAFGTLFFIAVPLGVDLWGHAEDAARARRQAPPSLACRSRLFDATMAGAHLRVPLIRGLLLNQGPDFYPAYLFDVPEQARKFCSDAMRSPPALTNLTVNFYSGVQSDPAFRQKPLCDAPRKEAWWPALCRFDRDAPPPVLELSLYDVNRYHAGKMMAWDADRGLFYAKYYPGLQWVPEGKFERAERGGEIEFRSAAWRGGASTYYAQCSPQHGDRLGCIAGYRLTPALGLVYQFRARKNSFERDALAADDYARKLATSFIAD